MRYQYKPSYIINSIFYVVVAIVLGGCSNFAYYLDSINGHYQVLEKAQPLDTVIKSDIPEKIKARLEMLQQARKFAVTDLLLPDNDSYKKYADLGRKYVAWNVIAAEKYSVKARQWCYWFVGCLSYRGYFSKQQAGEYAEKLKAQGLDVYVAGVRAYSTLGWSDDPLLNTMLFNNEADSAAVLFHELAHQKLYSDDVSFNEAFATAVEIEGTRRWLKRQNKGVQLEYYLTAKKRQVDFNNLIRKTRESLRQVYSNQQDPQLAEKKRAVFVKLHNDYLLLKESWNGYSGYDDWMSQDLNNAHLAIVSTYYDLVPYFQALLDAEGQNLASFYHELELLIELPAETREQKLKRWQ